MSAEPTSPWQESSEESYYVSITDMLIGLLFLFIIMLMYFALQLRMVTQELVTSEDTRNQLLLKVASYMSEHDVTAEVDLAAGVLRLPDEVLFEKSRDTPKQEGEATLRILAEALSAHLPCYSYQSTPRPATCGIVLHNVETIFIEGHTDSDPINPSGRIRDNWDLSASRASTAFRMLSGYQPELTGYLTAPPSDEKARPIMSVAGYADQRPIDRRDTEAAKSRNRRIDLRFVMASPTLELVEVADEPLSNPADPR